MTINLPTETYKRLLEAKRILEKIVTNYSATCLLRNEPRFNKYKWQEDIDAARKIIEGLED